MAESGKRSQRWNGALLSGSGSFVGRPQAIEGLTGREWHDLEGDTPSASAISSGSSRTVTGENGSVAGKRRRSKGKSATHVARGGPGSCGSLGQAEAATPSRPKRPCIKELSAAPFHVRTAFAFEYESLEKRPLNPLANVASWLVSIRRCLSPGWDVKSPRSAAAYLRRTFEFH